MSDLPKKLLQIMKKNINSKQIIKLKRVKRKLFFGLYFEVDGYIYKAVKFRKYQKDYKIIFISKDLCLLKDKK